MDRVGELRKRALDRVSHSGFMEKPGVRKMPQNLQRRPQLRVVAIANIETKMLLSWLRR